MESARPTHEYFTGKPAGKAALRPPTGEIPSVALLRLRAGQSACQRPSGVCVPQSRPLT
jgi:hypothetical protein